MAEGTQRRLDRDSDGEQLHEGGINARRPWYKALVQDMEPIWFTWCMNTGILGILYQQYNYQFPGLPVISTIAFVIDLVLFVIFITTYILRFAWFRKQAWHELVDNPTRLPLFSCPAIAWMTLTALTSLIVSRSQWGGYPFTVVAYVMWWFGLTWILGALFFVVVNLINRHELGSGTDSEELAPTAVIPAVSVATLAVVGATVASYSTGISVRMAVPVIVTSLAMVGISIVLAILLYAFLFHQLMAKGWPQPDMTPNIFVLVGPMGQSAAALQALGSAASAFDNFGPYDKGAFITAASAPILDTACTLLALLLCGMGAFWLIIAVYAMFHRAFERKLSWTASWNSIIFPTGTFALALEQLGISLDSPFCKVMAGILIVALTIVWFVNLAFTVYNVARGEMLIRREDPRLASQSEQQKEE